MLLAGLDRPWQLDWITRAGVGGAAVVNNATGLDEAWLPSPLSVNFHDWSPLALSALARVRRRVATEGRGGLATEGRGGLATEGRGGGLATEGRGGGLATYFPRTDASGRQMENEAELAARLEGLGLATRAFSTFPTVADRATYLSNHSLVVAPFGAACANLLASPRTARWLFLCPPTMCRSHEIKFVRRLADALGVAVEFSMHGSRDDKGAMNLPWRVDVEAVAADVKRALARRPPNATAPEPSPVA